MGEFKGGISTITLATGGQVYVQGWIYAVHLLRYKFISLELIETPTKCPGRRQGNLFLFPLRNLCCIPARPDFEMNHEAISRLVLRGMFFCFTLS